MVIWWPIRLAHASGKPRIAVWPGEMRASMVSGRLGMPWTPRAGLGRAKGTGVFRSFSRALHVPIRRGRLPCTLRTFGRGLPIPWPDLLLARACPGRLGRAKAQGYFGHFYGYYSSPYVEGWLPCMLPSFGRGMPIVCPTLFRHVLDMPHVHVPRPGKSCWTTPSSRCTKKVGFAPKGEHGSLRRGILFLCEE